MLKLLSAGKIGELTLKNRVIFPSMCHGYCTGQGMLTERLEEYVRERARGGVGTIILPGNPYGGGSQARMALTQEKHLPGWSKLANICHEYGCKLFVQLHPATYHEESGDELANKATPEDIAYFVNAYAKGAVLAERAGLDGVEIHGAHAHEVAQFLSPYYNRRTDEYGGDYKGRAKFAVEIIQEIKKQTNLPLIFRISSSEKIPGGREVTETMQIAPLLEKAGADALHVSVGTPLSESYISAPMDLPYGFNVDEVAQVKSVCSIPVIAVDRIVSPELAEDILQSGKADFVALGRAQLADPEFVNKIIEHRPYRPCLGCNQGCRNPYRKDIHCAQNPRTGREHELVYNPAPPELQDKKILIAGAGAAGLEAAVVLARRGCHPIVFEKSGVPGGLIHLAKRPPHKQDMQKIIDCRLAEARELKIDIRMGVPLTPRLAREEKADIVIVATGSRPIFTALEKEPSGKVYLADDIFASNLSAHKIAVLGGGLVGCEIAETLAAQGKAVTIFEMGDEIAKGLSAFNKEYLFKRMSETGVDVRLQARVEEIQLPSIRISSNGYSHGVGGFEAVVMAFGRRAESTLAEEIRAALPEAQVYVIGDADKPRLAMDAVYSAALCASEL